MAFSRSVKEFMVLSFSLPFVFVFSLWFDSFASSFIMESCINSNSRLFVLMCTDGVYATSAYLLLIPWCKFGF